jgi:uncharacterized membrane protein YhaH (DUF805 family)
MFTGRIDRLGYFLGGVYLVIPAIVVLAFVFGAPIIQPDLLDNFMGLMINIVGIICFIVILPILIGLTIRRLHDVAISGWFTAILCFPYVGGALSLVLLFLKSNNETNGYGTPQAPRGFMGILFGKKQDVAPTPATTARTETVQPGSLPKQDQIVEPAVITTKHSRLDGKRLLNIILAILAAGWLCVIGFAGLLFIFGTLEPQNGGLGDGILLLILPIFGLLLLSGFYFITAIALVIAQLIGRERVSWIHPLVAALLAAAIFVSARLLYPS